MKMRTTMKRWAMTILLVTLGGSMSACATGGFGGTSWKEEVLLHDGKKIVIERSVDRGGRHEIGQLPAYREQRIAFTLPATGQRVTWEDTYSEDIGTANFLPMLLDMDDNTPYLVASPMGCLSYNKWGRPNPPYVIFKYQDQEWKRIPLQELPAEIKAPNMIFSMPDLVVEKSGKRFMSAEMIQAITEAYKQPEFKTILREPLPNGQINQMCMEMVPYKGSWVMPNDPIARKFIDQQKK